MAHGTPDWGVTAGAVTVYQVTDLAELAARLGSPVTFDRRGDVVWFDSFEDGLHQWYPVGTAGGASEALSTARARNGLFSALLTAGTGSSDSAEIIHTQAMPVLSRLGTEASVSLGSPIASFDLQVSVFDGTTQTDFYVWWDDSDEQLKYKDVDGDTVVLASSIDLYQSTTLFHTLKLVVDASAGEYVRLIVDDQEYSMADIAGYVVGPGGPKRVRIIARLYGRAGHNDTVYVDDAILTQNEPA